mmetsp:Transcript_13340/g.47842  ORF Transcript_13340/g.47842 Transcript_13340/m.47842 type:complete len:238 (+) Transcript_13340:759-1472(+)|eukprot:30316-Pelagococcus_subviridis.AAC.2
MKPEGVVEEPTAGPRAFPVVHRGVCGWVVHSELSGATAWAPREGSPGFPVHAARDIKLLSPGVSHVVCLEPRLDLVRFHGRVFIPRTRVSQGSIRIHDVDTVLQHLRCSLLLRGRGRERGGCFRDERVVFLRSLRVRVRARLLRALDHQRRVRRLEVTPFDDIKEVDARVLERVLLLPDGRRGGRRTRGDLTDVGRRDVLRLALGGGAGWRVLTLRVAVGVRSVSVTLYDRHRAALI